MPILRGRVWNRRRGVPLEARVQVMASTGALCAPEAALHKVGPGDSFSYADAAASRTGAPRRSSIASPMRRPANRNEYRQNAEVNARLQFVGKPEFRIYPPTGQPQVRC